MHIPGPCIGQGVHRFMRIWLFVWRWALYVPLAIIRSIRTPLGCTVVARLLLLLFGVFCLVVPRPWLAYENLPTRYKDLSFLGGIFYYLGFLVVFIAVCGLLQCLFRAWKNSRS